jgi:hypothetical protein
MVNDADLAVRAAVEGLVSRTRPKLWPTVPALGPALGLLPALAKLLVAVGIELPRLSESSWFEGMTEPENENAISIAFSIERNSGIDSADLVADAGQLSCGVHVAFVEVLIIKTFHGISPLTTITLRADAQP